LTSNLDERGVVVLHLLYPVLISPIMGNTVAIPTISHLPDHVSGWVANEFKEYNKQKREVVHTYKTLDRLGKGGFGAVYKVYYLNVILNSIVFLLILT
jgi:hypothetical protein